MSLFSNFNLFLLAALKLIAAIFLLSFHFSVTLYNTGAQICIKYCLTNAEIIMSLSKTHDELNHLLMITASATNAHIHYMFIILYLVYTLLVIKRLENIFRKNQGMILADLPHLCVLPLTNSVVSLEEKRRQTCNYFKS